jgi:hypothetical protein
VANAGLKVAVFSWSCGRAARVAGKGLSEEGLNAETQNAQRLGKDGIRAEGDRKLGCGWLERGRNMGNDSRILQYCQVDNRKM